MTGIICLDKDKDMTSFSCVAALRRIAGEKKAGHAGTLDPMATGVLPIFFGGATRFMELLPDHNKGYRATVKLGLTTDTLDTTGETLTTSDIRVTRGELEAVLPRFRGDIMQVPPMYSALSKDGVRLYELARKGIEVEREARPVTIEKLELLEFDEENQSFVIDVMCSKGTYIRTLADDIGRALGCGAAMSDLRRTFAAGFSIEKCCTLDELRELKENGNLESAVISVPEAMGIYPEFTVTEAQAKRFHNGGALDLVRVRGEKKIGFYRVYSPDKVFLGIGEITEAMDELKVKRVYNGV